MAKAANRDKNAEKAVKERIQKTHIKSFRIVGSEVGEECTVVYILRMLGTDNYLFKIKTNKGADGKYEMSGFIPVTDWQDYGDYRVYNPKPASAEVLKPTESERKKFKGYN
ncbi:MAG: hypothetical protein IJL99_06630 [Firmicutes bacterium]|nr:hypothetical protein [Bacillota bacterium]